MNTLVVLAVAAGMAAADKRIDLAEFARAVEYTGEAIGALSMQERMTLSNMAAELGGQAGLIAPDATTAAWLAGVGVDAGDWSHLRTDADADLAEHHVFDAAALAPQRIDEKADAQRLKLFFQQVLGKSAAKEHQIVVGDRAGDNRLRWIRVQ